MIESGRERLRVGSWRSEENIAYLSPIPGAPLPSTDFVRRCIRDLELEGYAGVVTGALSPAEQATFRAAGFEVTEHLHLLSHDLQGLPALVDRNESLRRGGRHDPAAVLDLDRIAFDAFWRLDEGGLDDALRATPHTRFRVAVTGEVGPEEATAILGYAITGRSGRHGYLQRLAVHPESQRQGLGTLLVLDGLRWLRRWRVEKAMVNTQLANEGALALYERLGFRREPSGLSVLARELHG